MACLFSDGSINLIELADEKSPACGNKEKSCSGTLKVRIKGVINSPGKVLYSANNGDYKAPFMITARDGEQILVLRHFADNHRRIHAYETSEGKELFNIDLDADLHISSPGEFGLHPSTGPLPFKLNEVCIELSVDEEGNFLCVSDMTSVVIWNSKSGKFIRQITIPKHQTCKYGGVTCDRALKFCQGALIMVHNETNFPNADIADILLFW